VVPGSPTHIDCSHNHGIQPEGDESVSTLGRADADRVYVGVLGRHGHGYDQQRGHSERQPVARAACMHHKRTAMRAYPPMA